MPETPGTTPFQPFTFAGVARYAQARPARLAGAALVFALASSAVLAALFALCWAPVIRQAVASLPEQGAIRAGNLVWPDQKISLLGASQFVSFAAGPGGSEASAPVDFAFQFEPDQFSVRSLLGTAAIPYPRALSIELNRASLLPHWGAWEKALIPLVMLGASLALLASWSLLALPYALLIRCLALLLGKTLNFRESWKLSVAAQWPGAVLLSFVLALYAAGQTTLLLLSGAFLAHFLLTFFYLAAAPFCLPRAAANPFTPEPPPPKRGQNPFKPR